MRKTVTQPEKGVGNLRHGHCRDYKQSPEHVVWTHMKQRCLNPRCKQFSDYGGRGIRIHPAWVQSFEAFYADVGPRPTPKHSIDRIDNNGHYEPGNAQWSTKAIQQANRRNSNRLTLNGETLTLVQWARKLGVSYQCLQGRIKRGLALERVLHSNSLIV